MSRRPSSPRTKRNTPPTAPKVFLSYSSSDSKVAKRIRLELKQQGYPVFFGPEALPPGRTYNTRIRKSVESCDLFVFLISPRSVRKGSYTLTELRMAERKWENPEGRILPVMVAPTSKDDLEPYLSAVSIYAPEGDIPAEVAGKVRQLAKEVVPGWGDHDVLRQRAEQLGHRIRDFLRNAEWREQSVEPKFPFGWRFPSDPTIREVERENFRRQARRTLQAEHGRQCEDLFVAEARRLRDEILSRVRLDRTDAPTYEKPSYPAGVEAIANDLDEIARALPQ